MPNFSGGTRSAGAGSTTLPVGSLYAIASLGGDLYEVAAFNTTTTAVAVKLVRLTSAGTPGAGLTEGKKQIERAAANMTLFDTHTGAPTLGDDMGYRAQLGAAIGSGIIWPIRGGIEIPAGTANGVGIIVATGTGQVLDWWMEWEE
jgi:hypothetical protein